MADGDEPRIEGSHVAELSRFFNAHDQWLFGHACVRANGDQELAADLVQDTFEAAARVWAALREHDTGRQRAWLLATVANKNVSEFRRNQAFRRRQPDIHRRYQPTAADTEAQALNAIALKQARQIIDSLPPRQRQIALMRWQDHMKATEIATTTTTTTTTEPEPRHDHRRARQPRGAVRGRLPPRARRVPR
jgi:RNA polymerase sigma factor (sigma-70 family)